MNKVDLNDIPETVTTSTFNGKFISNLAKAAMVGAIITFGVHYIDYTLENFARKSKKRSKHHQ